MTIVVRIIRIVVLLAALAAVMTGIVMIAAGSASAAPTPVIGVGTKIVPVGAIGGCNVAVIEGHTFKTAGHCGKVGDKFADTHGNTVGTVIRTTTYDGNVTAHQPDVAIVQIARGVIVRNEARTTGNIAAPGVGMHVCKHGHGIANAVRRCGEIIAVTQYGIAIKGMAVTPYDSGSPVIDARGNVVGIVSGSPSLIDAVLSAARAVGIPVPDGVSVASRADYDFTS